jgi:hypothetical protein
MQIVAQFLDKTLAKEEWTHAAHLKVGLWHLLHHTPTEAMLLMRCRIIAYNDATQTPNTIDRGYHETLTYFWIWAIEQFLASADIDRNTPFKALADQLLASPFADRGLPFKYFERDQLFSTEGRAMILSFDQSRLIIQSTNKQMLT